MDCSILESKDITLLTKVHIVKAMVFPVVMYRYESWTIKKVEKNSWAGHEDKVPEYKWESNV